jgi:hypothetical protein
LGLRDKRALLRRARNLFGERLAEVILTHRPERLDGLEAAAARLSPSELDPLVEAVRIADWLHDVAGTETIQAWFVGNNPLLNDEEPVLAIRTDPGAVWNAAKHFVAYG